MRRGLNGTQLAIAVKLQIISINISVIHLSKLLNPERFGGVTVSDLEIKPLNWTADDNIGYTVERRPDGGMQYTFMDVSHATLEHWRQFSIDHLIDSDRLTRNLYDLRQVAELPAEAFSYALELSNDPATRNIRLAVVVSSEQVKRSVDEIIALTPPGGLRICIFTDMDSAEAWLARPLTQVI
jgi:hypothetical protein